MISDMIDHEEGVVHIQRSPDLTSPASETFWAAMNNDDTIRWHGGALCFSAMIPHDAPSSNAFREQFGSAGVPALFYDMAVSVDLDLPAAAEIVGILDPFLLPMSFDAPAFNMPANALPADIARCFVASRIAWECFDHLVLPTLVPRADFRLSLAAVAWNALAIGGVEVYTIAKSITGHPGFWTRSTPHGGVAIDFGD